MIALEQFSKHLASLDQSDWERLFVLLPEIDNAEKFGEIEGGERISDGTLTFPNWKASDIVNKTTSVISQLNLTPVFDWTKWKEGKLIISDKNLDYCKLDTITLCKLLTTIIRADRFNDGFLISCFKRGIISKIIKALKSKQQVYNQNIIWSIKSVLFGVAIGDALGVPVEFKSREYLCKNPVLDMIGYGMYNLPPGTFSDDSSLTFCLAEALTEEFNFNTIGQNFVKWYYKNYWTPRGNVFDIGNSTRCAIERLAKGEKPELAGCSDALSNGNGSLMRISPLLFYLLDKPLDERFEITKQVSSITHSHIRSVIACFYYLEFARKLLECSNKFDIYENLKTEIRSYLISLFIDRSEIEIFDRLLTQNIYELNKEKIYSSGYVLHTLEASIWCLLTTENYKDAVLKA
jgi:ADP-ribosyl-[dinitrogen reductase] hydrolase